MCAIELLWKWFNLMFCWHLWRFSWLNVMRVWDFFWLFISWHFQTNLQFQMVQIMKYWHCPSAFLSWVHRIYSIRSQWNFKGELIHLPQPMKHLNRMTSSFFKDFSLPFYDCKILSFCNKTFIVGFWAWATPHWQEYLQLWRCKHFMTTMNWTRWPLRM